MWPISLLARDLEVGMRVLNLTYASGIRLMRLELELNFQDFKYSVENLCLYV